jgi:type IV pilus assembly protein PilY1
LASVAPIDINNDRKIDIIYAGDLFGNLWKFDVSDSDPDNWAVAFGSSSNPLPLFTAEAENGNSQSIMVRPEVGRHKSRGGLLVYFGTGKYIEVADNTRQNQDTQTLYALWDNGSRITSRTELQKQEIIKEGDIAIPQTGGESQQVSYRVTTDNTVDWANKRGWYLDLMNTDGGNTDNKGERVIYAAALRDNRIIFTSMLPTDDVCEPGGSGWIMEFDAQSGSRVSDIIYDLDNDGQANDRVNIGTTSSPEMVGVSGLQIGVGLPTAPGFVGLGNNGDFVLATGSDSNIVPIRRFASRSLGRQSWRQVY